MREEGIAPIPRLVAVLVPIKNHLSKKGSGWKLKQLLGRDDRQPKERSVSSATESRHPEPYFWLCFQTWT